MTTIPTFTRYCNSLAEWQRLPEPERSSLFYLRAMREAMMRELELDLPGLEDQLDSISNMDEYHGSAYRQIQEELGARDKWNTMGRLEVFNKVCLRIGYLERKRAGVHYIPADMEAA